MIPPSRCCTVLWLVSIETKPGGWIALSILVTAAHPPTTPKVEMISP